jgi:hypothetical protein
MSFIFSYFRFICTNICAECVDHFPLDIAPAEQFSYARVSRQKHSFSGTTALNS